MNSDKTAKNDSIGLSTDLPPFTENMGNCIRPTDDYAGNWLDYGVLCMHDEGLLCKRRYEYLLEHIDELRTSKTN